MITSRAIKTGKTVGITAPRPRDGDAQTDYNEGYAKGHYEFSQQTSSPPTPAATSTEPSPEGGASADRTAELDQQFKGWVAEGNWPLAAEVLNGFNSDDIHARLAGLTPDQISSLHQGALENPRLGPQSQVAMLSQSEIAVASSSATDPETGLTADDVGRMDLSGKLIASLKSAIHQSPAAFGAQVDALLQPEALAEFAFFTALFAALQSTPAGWVTDLAIIGLEAYLIGPLVYQGVKDLLDFFSIASGAKTPADIRAAGRAFADAAGILGIAILMKLIFHEGGAAEEEAPNGGAKVEPGKPPETVAETSEPKPAESAPGISEIPTDPVDVQALLDETAPKTKLSRSELRAEKAIADRLPAESINEPPFTLRRELPNGHEIKETADGRFCERCSGPCAVYNADGDLITEDVPSFEEEFGHPEEEPGRMRELQSRAPFEQEPLERGRDADRVQAHLYKANQVRLNNGRGPILDSYNPGDEIVSRKDYQLAKTRPEVADFLLDEILDKYARGNVIADTAENRAQLPADEIGKPLSGRYVLEVAPQIEPIPTELLERAERLQITIRDYDGVVYTK